VDENGGARSRERTLAATGQSPASSTRKWKWRANAYRVPLSPDRGTGTSASAVPQRDSRLSPVPMRRPFTVFDHHFGMTRVGGCPIPSSRGRRRGPPLRWSKKYKHRGIGLNLAFSNLLSGEAALGRKVLQLNAGALLRTGNSVVVGSHVLAEHIRDHYPQYRLVHSLAYFNEEPAHYYRYSEFVVVLPRHLNFRPPVVKEELDNLGPARVEVPIVDHHVRR